MATSWLRRGWLLAACASVLLAACGGGGVDSQFTPDRVVAFGDAFGDLGQNGARYTVNDGSTNNWTQFVAQGYGRTLVASNAGGQSYAQGSARVAAQPDAGGNAATPTVTAQIDAFLAAGGPASGDLVLLSGGIADVIVQARAVLDGTLSEEAARLAVEEAGRAYGAQVRRLVNAGATHVVVAGSYNLGRSPWARQTGREGLFESLSGRFNDQLLVSIVDLGNRVLYVDAALFFNLVTGNPSSQNLSDGQTPVCTSIDPGPGIGTGSNEVNSNRCTPATILAGADYGQYLFADRVYPTPRGHQLFGDYAHGRIKDRW